MIDVLQPGPEGRLRVVVVADTHSHPHPLALQHIRALAPGAIVHAGDIGDHSVIDDLERIAPVLAVRGNIDIRRLPDERQIVLGAVGRACRILLVHIGVNGPRIRADVRRRAAEVGAQLVICGHSHVPFIGTDRGLTVFNPGSVGPRRFRLPIVFGTLDLGPDGLRMAHVDAETGARWLPPT